MLEYKLSARLLGREDIGQLAVGKCAEFFLVDSRRLELVGGAYSPADVLATVRKLNREQGMTVIWITHFMEEAAVADHVVVLDKGKIALDGTPAEVFSQVQKVKALGLDVPPMAELAMRLRAGGLSLPDGILTVADMVKELKKALCPSK